MDTSSKENIQLFCKNSVQPVERPSFKMEYPSSKGKQPCCGELKVFLGALSFVYFAKALAEGYLKSTITQIERRFDIPSSLVGVIDGSFEIGNLLVITFVSYFGAKLHRPKIIGAGCLIMGVGTLLIAVPQFFMEKYRYEKSSPFSNATLSISPCLLESSSQLPISVMEKSQTQISDECEVDASSSMWVYVFLGNLLRGLGETPIQPLGIAYLDDFATEDNAAFYIDHITITPKDPQWVGAWWLGYLIAGSLSLLAAVPFWCLPKSLSRPQSAEDSNSSSEKSKFIIDDHINYQTPHGEKAKVMEMARDFLPSLKTLFGNPVYFLYLCASTVQFNSLFGMVTYKPKYIEQQYGQSSSKANFVIGLINIPAVALGIFSGGIVMKKFRIGVCGAAKLYLGSSVFGYLLFLSLFALGCENSDVAGLTISYQGTKPVSYHERALFSDCNSRCKCSETKWEPMCGENGITYASACLAGCQASNRTGKNVVFLGAMSLCFICKGLGVAVMKSSITQIEKRFDISSSVAGVIDGGFEIGNLLVIVFVSYYGSKLHRPKIIGIGTFIMGTGSIMTALPHFFMGYYKYSTEAIINPSENSTLTCLINKTLSPTGTPPEIMKEGCEKESSYMWIYVLMGNMLRGIGETPIMPLGISYIDDFAKEGHSSVYIGGLSAVGMIGPIIGFLMGSLFLKMYVDIGYVDLRLITLPAVATGMFSGGYIIKRLKLTLIGIAKLSFYTYLMSIFFSLLQVGLICESKSIAGITLTYDGYAYLGLSGVLKFLAVLLYIVLLYAMKRKYDGKDTKASENGRKTMEEANLESLNNNGCFAPSGIVKETHI
ncbi:Solute carrier organic anion transporter family member 1C1 [Sciurus carolinensis]|uniref:Solute carrier organic anion transporter family member 1C1 n=1 Tax=Sciurus carolinensis TaxID=30640 RepID=A0AA41SRW8_SCICA|nr:Solute carrier organic anion transporter family member 1C1 [Sciurus carolinensis]